MFSACKLLTMCVTAMGIISSTFYYYMSRTDDPDPITTLTSRDKYVIQSSWAPVKSDLTGNGVTLLLLFFDKFPEEKLHFPFKDVPKEELRASKKFQAHCNSVMTALDALIANLHDGELLVNLLEKIGKSHHRHGLKPPSFAHLHETVLELFGTFMTNEAVQTWDKLLKVAFSVTDKYL